MVARRVYYHVPVHICKLMLKEPTVVILLFDLCRNTLNMVTEELKDPHV